MATSGQVKSNVVGTEGRTYLYVAWARLSTWNYSGGTCGSTIKWELWLHNGNEWYINAIRCYEININGSKVSDGGVWSNYTTSGDYKLLEGTTNVQHDNDGKKTFNINFSGWFFEEGNVSGNANFTLDTIKRLANITKFDIYARGLNSLGIIWDTDVECDEVQYSKDNGTNYTSAGNLKQFLVTGLQPATTYPIKIKVKNASSQEWTEISYALNGTTYKQGTITSASNFNDEENPTINYTNESGYNCDYLQACISLTGSQDDISYRDIPKTGTSYTFNLTEAERNILRNATTTSNSRTVIFYIRTILGNDIYYSTVSKTLSIVNANPIFSNFTYQNTNPYVTTTLGTNQILVKGLSPVKVKITTANKMSAQKGATPQRYNAILGSKSDTKNYSASSTVNLNLDVINESGEKSLVVRAYDSRNNYTEVTKYVTILDYAKPVINATLTRQNNFENTTTITLSGTYSRLIVNNTDKNTIESVKYRYRESGGAWNSQVELTPTVLNGTYSCSNVTLNLDNTKAFEFEIEVKDKLQTTTNTYIVDVGQAIFFISSNLKKCFINGKRVLTEDEILDMVYPVGAIYMSVNSTSPATLFGGTWVAWGTGRVPVGVDTSQTEFDTVEETGGEKTHTLTVNEIPSHNHKLGLSAGGNETGYGLNYEYSNNWRYYQGTDIIESTGGGQAHNNLQPYITCYMWKRTA